MKKIELNNDDANQVRAILRTHAEMQDMRVIPSMEVLSRLIADASSPEEIEIIKLMKEGIEDIEQDSQNLSRIADLFI